MLLKESLIKSSADEFETAVESVKTVLSTVDDFRKLLVSVKAAREKGRHQDVGSRVVKVFKKNGLDLPGSWTVPTLKRWTEPTLKRTDTDTAFEVPAKKAKPDEPAKPTGPDNPDLSFLKFLRDQLVQTEGFTDDDAQTLNVVDVADENDDGFVDFGVFGRLCSKWSQIHCHKQPLA